MLLTLKISGREPTFVTFAVVRGRRRGRRSGTRELASFEEMMLQGMEAAHNSPVVLRNEKDAQTCVQEAFCVRFGPCGDFVAQMGRLGCSLRAKKHCLTPALKKNRTAILQQILTRGSCQRATRRLIGDDY